MQKQRSIVVDNYQITPKMIDAAFKMAKPQNKTNQVLAQTFRLLNLNKIYQSNPTDPSVKQAMKNIVDSSFLPPQQSPRMGISFDLSEAFPLNKLGTFGRTLQRRCRLVEKGVMQFQDEKQQPKLKEIKAFVNKIQGLGQPQNDNKIGWFSQQKKYPFRIILIDKTDGHRGIYFNNLQKAQKIRIALSQNYNFRGNVPNLIGSLSQILRKETVEYFRSKFIARNKMINKSTRFSRKVNIADNSQNQINQSQSNLPQKNPNRNNINQNQSVYNRIDPNVSIFNQSRYQSPNAISQSKLPEEQKNKPVILPVAINATVNKQLQQVNNAYMADFVKVWNQKAEARQRAIASKKNPSPQNIQMINSNSRLLGNSAISRQSINNMKDSYSKKQQSVFNSKQASKEKNNEFFRALNSNIYKNSQLKEKDSYIKQFDKDNRQKTEQLEFHSIQFLTLTSLFFKPIITIQLIRNNKTEQSILYNTIIKRKEPILSYDLLKSNQQQSLRLNANLKQYDISVKVIDFLANEEVVSDKLSMKNKIVRQQATLLCENKLINLQLGVTKSKQVISQRSQTAIQQQNTILQLKIPPLSQAIKQKINIYWQNQSQSQGYYNQTNLTIYKILRQIQVIPLTWWKDVSEDDYQLLQIVYTASKILGFKMIRAFPYIIQVFVKIYPNLQQMTQNLLSFILTFLKVYYFPQYLNRLQKFHKLLGLDEDCEFISKINLQIMVIDKIVEIECPLLVNKLNRKNLIFGYQMMEYIYEVFSRNFSVNHLIELWNFLYQDLQLLQLNMALIAVCLIKYYQEDLLKAKRLKQFCRILQSKKISRLSNILAQLEDLKQKYFGQTKGIIDQIKNIFNSKPLQPVIYEFYKKQTAKIDRRKKDRYLQKKSALRKVNRQIDIDIPQYPKKHLTLHIYFMKLPDVGGSLTLKCNQIDYQCLNHQKNRYFIISQISSTVFLCFLDLKSNQYTCQLIFTQGIHQNTCYMKSSRNSTIHKVTYVSGLLTDSQIQIFKKGKKFDHFISPFLKVGEFMEEMNRPLHQTHFLRKYDNTNSKDDLVKKIKGLFSSGSKVFNEVQFYIEQIQTSDLTIQQKFSCVRQLARQFSLQFCLCHNRILQKHFIRQLLESTDFQITNKQFQCFYNDSLQYEFDAPKILKCRYYPSHQSNRQIKLQLVALNYFINKSSTYIFCDIIVDDLIQAVKGPISQQLGGLYEGELKLHYSSGGQVFMKSWQLKLKNKNKQIYYEQIKEDVAEQIEQMEIGEPQLLMTQILPSFAKISTILDYVNANRTVDLKAKYQDKDRKKIAQNINLLKDCQPRFNKVVMMRHMVHPQKLNFPFFNYYYELTHNYSTPLVKTVFLNNLKTDLKTVCLFKGQLKFGQNSKVESYTYQNDIGLYGNLRLMSKDGKGWFFFGSAKEEHQDNHEIARVFVNYGYGVFRWQNCKILGFETRARQTNIKASTSKNNKQNKLKKQYLIVRRNQQKYVQQYQLEISPQALQRVEQIGEPPSKIQRPQRSVLEDKDDLGKSEQLRYLSKFIK